MNCSLLLLDVNTYELYASRCAGHCSQSSACPNIPIPLLPDFQSSHSPNEDNSVTTIKKPMCSH